MLVKSLAATVTNYEKITSRHIFFLIYGSHVAASEPFVPGMDSQFATRRYADITGNFSSQSSYKVIKKTLISALFARLWAKVQKFYESLRCSVISYS